MARRHALVSLRHAAFFLGLLKKYLKRDEKLVKFYDVVCLLCQRIIKTALLDFSVQSPAVTNYVVSFQSAWTYK